MRNVGIAVEHCVWHLGKSLNYNCNRISIAIITFCSLTLATTVKIGEN